MLGVGFWAAIAFGVLCVLAGAALASFGPRLLAERLVPVAAPAPAATLQQPSPTAALPAVPAPVASGEPDGSPAMADLNMRVAALEAQEARTAQAAGAALAAAAVVEASQGSGPFADQLGGLIAVAPASPELAALTRLAETGAPSRAAVAASFADYAARAASAARAPGEGAGFGDQINYAFSRVVSLRRVGLVPGNGVDAILARAERQVEDGDLDHALATLDRLPGRSRDAMAAWRERAARRAEIDRNAAAVRARALQSLAAASRSGE
jgi:hypothetical protein